MHTERYHIPIRQPLRLLSGSQEPFLTAITQQCITIDDIDRAYFLLKGGYLPKWLSNFHREHASALIDWALVNNMGPAYWSTSSEKELSVRSAKLHPTASLTYQKPCDRRRIDQILLERVPKDGSWKGEIPV
jgi:hypothetical protein